MNEFKVGSFSKKKLQEVKSEKPKWLTNAISAAVPTTILAGAAIAANRAGFSVSDVMDTQVLLQPPVIDNAIDGMVLANNSLREVAPVAAVGLVGLQIRNSVSGLLNKQDEYFNKLSKLDYSGLNDISSPDNKNKTINHLRRVGAGTYLAAVAIGLVSATSGLEKEITEGPMRPIDAVTKQIADQVPNATDKPYFVLQDEKNTLMDDSAVSERDINNLYLQGRRVGVTVVPFNKSLFNFNGESAMQFAVPDKVFEKMADVNIDSSCDTVPVIVDKTAGVGVGEEADLNGFKVQVVKVDQDKNMAQMNRSIAMISDSDYKKCLKNDTDASYFGAIIPDADEEQVTKLINQAKANKLAVVDEVTFKENNREFWRANSTPLVIELMLCIAGISAIAAASQRRGLLEHNKNEIGSLMASGVKAKRIDQIEVRRALSDSIKSTALAAPFVPIITAAFNASSSGLSVSAGPRELMTGMTLITFANLFAARSAVKSFKNDLNLAQAVK